MRKGESRVPPAPDENDYSAGMGLLLVLAIIVVIAVVAVLGGRRRANTAALPTAHVPDTPADASRPGWESDLEAYRAPTPNY